MNSYATEQIQWIKGTALGVTVRDIHFVAPHAHEKMIEITMCLKGNLVFSYCFEEFRLGVGEFILVDRDTHFLYSDKGAICVSFYINLEQERGIYRKLINQMFVCEGTADSEVEHNTSDHKNMRGMLLAILVYLIKNNMMKPAYYSDFDAVNEKCGKSNCCNRHDEYSGMKPEFYDGIWKVTDRLIELIYYRFDICQWSSRNTKLTEKQLIRLKKIVEYMFLHCNETITLKDVAEVIDVTEGYVSNLLSKYAIGFYNIVTYIRSWKAERMLLSTNMSITETAAECHFSSTKYMYAAFDYWYKCKPNEFRKKYRSEMKKKNIETVIAVNDVQQLVDELVNKQLISMYMEDDDLYG